MKEAFLRSLLCLTLGLIPALGFAGFTSEGAFIPDATYLFAARDNCELLYMDIYEPTPGADTTASGQVKPSILFVFGGGFVSGRRDNPSYLPWYRMMAENGYRIIAIDYRLGLKGVKSVGIAQVNTLDKAIHMAVEDLFSATAFIMDNADALGIDPDNIVISGSSAGAITVLQAEYELCNRTSCTDVLPAGFNYAGVMSFSGAILSRKGKLRFARTPCPLLLFHGTKDKLVPYKQIRFLRLGFFGTFKIVRRLQKFGFTYNVRRYAGHRHEIAEIMDLTVAGQMDFIQTNVMDGVARVVDTIVEKDPRISGEGTSQSRKEMYGKD